MQSKVETTASVSKLDLLSVDEKPHSCTKAAASADISSVLKRYSAANGPHCLQINVTDISDG